MRVRATYQGKVVAESSETVVVEGNHYFPRQDVDLSVLQPSESHTTCPWKGEASYFDVVVDGARNPDAAWYYPDPKDAAREITDRLAFWKGIVVEEVPAA